VHTPQGVGLARATVRPPGPASATRGKPIARHVGRAR